MIANLPGLPEVFHIFEGIVSQEVTLPKKYQEV